MESPGLVGSTFIIQLTHQPLEVASVPRSKVERILSTRALPALVGIKWARSAFIFSLALRGAFLFCIGSDHFQPMMILSLEHTPHTSPLQRFAFISLIVQ